MVAAKLKDHLINLLDIPNKCADLDNTLDIYETDLGCAKTFKAKASAADWKRLIEIDQMGNRHVGQN